MTETGAEFLTDPTSVERVVRLLEDRPVPAVLGIAADERSDLVAWQSQPAESTVMPVAVVMDGATYARWRLSNPTGAGLADALSSEMVQRNIEWRWFPKAARADTVDTCASPPPIPVRADPPSSGQTDVERTEALANYGSNRGDGGRLEESFRWSTAPLYFPESGLRRIPVPRGPRATGSGRWSTGPGGSGCQPNPSVSTFWPGTTARRCLSRSTIVAFSPRGSRRPPAQPEPLSAGSGSVHFPAPCAGTRMSTSGPIRSAIGSARGSPGGGREVPLGYVSIVPLGHDESPGGHHNGSIGNRSLRPEAVESRCRGGWGLHRADVGGHRDRMGAGRSGGPQGLVRSQPTTMAVVRIGIGLGEISVRHPSRRVLVAARHRAQFGQGRGGGRRVRGIPGRGHPP